jgi:nitroreductase
MTQPLSNADLLTQLHWRYAVKKFDPARRISDKDWQILEESLILSPSSFGLQPFSFIVVNDAQVRIKLREVSWKQSQVTDASHYMAFAIQEKITEEDVEKFFDRMITVRQVPAEKMAGYKSLIIGTVVKAMTPAMQQEWMARQLYIALGNLMTCAAVLGIDTCAMEGIDPLQYDEILGLKKQGHITKCGLALGYRHTEDAYANAKKVRMEKKDLIKYV